MRAIDFPESNAQYGKPESMTDEECFPISAYEHRNTDGDIVAITTQWQPNEEDLKAINSGRPIVFQMTAGFLVPHVIYTTNEKGEYNG